MSAFELPPLPYHYDALEPVLGAHDVRLHHDVVHKGHVDALNNAIAGHPDFAAQPIEPLLRNINAVPSAIRDQVRYHGGAHANHQFLWKVIQPGGELVPSGSLADEISRVFETFDSFRARVMDAAKKINASGWLFLVTNSQGIGLEILPLPDEESVLPLGKPGLFALDLWEHAWFGRYPGERSAYLSALLHRVNWTTIRARLDAIRRGDEHSLGGPAR